ncbi:MAG: ribonuclease HII [Bacteroidales bacterium]|nr:ribonuclease HII [Bacteroidales bacterium]
MLQQYYKSKNILECGCDEAGRGCLCGSVFAAAVILPSDFSNDLLNDSKQLSDKQRRELRPIIEQNAISFAVCQVSNEEIDKINILNASILAMNRAIKNLETTPDLLLIDGNRFHTDLKIPYITIVKGDGKMMSIAAASILAKTYRDDYMISLDKQYPQYEWKKNKGYPTKAHRNAIQQFGTTPYHRKTFNLLGQLSLFDN